MEEVTSKSEMSKSFEISSEEGEMIEYENYCDYSVSDIELNRIVMHYIKNFPKELTDNTVNQFPDFLAFFGNSLPQMQFPFFTNCLEAFLHRISDKDMQKFFTFLVIGKINLFTPILKSFFYKSVKRNNFGLSDKIKSILQTTVLESEEFDLFAKKLAKWHTLTEIISLYFHLLNKLYKKKFNFSLKTFSLDENFDFSIKKFAKLSLLRLAGFICDNISLKPNVDCDITALFFAATLSYGLNLPSIIISNQKTFEKLAVTVTLNLLIGKLGTALKYKSDFVVFKEFPKIMSQINEQLKKIERKTYEYMKLEMNKEFEFVTENEKDYKDKLDQLAYTIDQYLKGVNLEKEVKKVENELIEMSQKNIKIDDDPNDEWIMLITKKENEK